MLFVNKINSARRVIFNQFKSVIDFTLHLCFQFINKKETTVDNKFQLQHSEF